MRKIVEFVSQKTKCVYVEYARNGLRNAHKVFGQMTYRVVTYFAKVKTVRPCIVKAPVSAHFRTTLKYKSSTNTVDNFSKRVQPTWKERTFYFFCFLQLVVFFFCHVLNIVYVS